MALQFQRWACQWGCSSPKASEPYAWNNCEKELQVGALLADKPAAAQVHVQRRMLVFASQAKAVNSMVLRLAATSSRLSSHDVVA